MSDRRYSTARWQRLRKALLANYGRVCQIQGPRCTGYATTVHHLIPSSQAPQLFWEPSNLVASCPRCNYGDGARVAAENTRATNERLRALVEEQQQIAQMAERLARYEDQMIQAVQLGILEANASPSWTDRRAVREVTCARI